MTFLSCYPCRDSTTQTDDVAALNTAAVTGGALTCHAEGETPDDPTTRAHQRPTEGAPK